MTSALNTLLSNLPLPGRVINALRRSGYFFVRDLLGTTRSDLLRIRHLGPQSLRELETCLHGYGLGIHPDDPQQRFGLRLQPSTTMPSTFTQLRVQLSLQAEQLELLHFLISNEWARILRDSPSALYSPDTYASRISELRDLITFERDRNLVPAAADSAAA